MEDREFEFTKKFWAEEILRGNLIWPDGNVIRFAKRNFKPDRSCTVLDYGCGGGRNSIALAMEGFSCIAMDYNAEALEVVRRKMSERGITNIRLIQNEGFEVPVEEGSVDAIVASGSLFYNRASDIEKILSNMRKCLKDQGLMWADWRSKSDSLFRKGEYLEEGLYKLQNGTKREGCCYFFGEAEEIEEMYRHAGLKVKSLDSYEYTENNGNIRCSYFHVVAQRD
jgi:Methylase involved in ubiquinone/menaquinone biosynthesis